MDVTVGVSSSLTGYLVYFLLFDILKKGQSLGKSITNIKVVTELGNANLDNNTLIKRTVLKMVSIFILPISVLILLISEKHVIHDYFSKTVTVSD